MFPFVPFYFCQQFLAGVSFVPIEQSLFEWHKTQVEKLSWLCRNEFCKTMAISALAVKKCIKAKDYHRVAIPFLIGRGGMCSLFVTTLDIDGIPCIKVVGYPGGHQALEQTYTTASHCFEIQSNVEIESK